MAAQGHNRYALFTAYDDNGTPLCSPAKDPSNNPFVNQVADDSIPWQEVKKRGAQSGQPVSQAGRTQNRNGKLDATHNVVPPNKSRVRVTSVSTTRSGDKINDAYDNWCGVCSQKFSSKTALLSHIKQLPNHEHYCNLCKRVFKDRNGIKNHVDNSSGHKIFCNICLSAFKDDWALKNHYETNYYAEHQFVCFTCLLGFRTQADFDRHLQTAEKHTWCETCSRRFRNQDERDEHWQKTCKHKHCLQPGCNFDCRDQATLTAHLHRDHFQCEGCKRIFPSQTKFRQHQETCSSPIPCPECGEVCVGEAQMALHMESCEVYNDPQNIHSNMVDHTQLMLVLGKWWYSPLYMDLDIHAQIRTGRIDLHEVLRWMDEDTLHPFMCRSEGCTATFAHLRTLVLHCEDTTACNWDIGRLRLADLEIEFKRLSAERNGTVEEE
ncbi:hypothetical protein N0V83_006827 [Neocucurbitaria cava]|uniref:C2H2-type domain-containing protein n=1 Tax=Neocucurbitaria cava TaxID=798079 RepID=A0A9W8Y615_9PLEO|nr:hypothetical protein N0V83_006827 [Neocucurbitaria cava]